MMPRECFTKDITKIFKVLAVNSWVGKKGVKRSVQLRKSELRAKSWFITNSGRTEMSVIDDTSVLFQSVSLNCLIGNWRSCTLLMLNNILSDKGCTLLKLNKILPDTTIFSEG